MRIGLTAIGTPELEKSLNGLINFVKDAEQRGFNTVWVPQLSSLDAVDSCGYAGWETERIELGTGVTSTFPRHPCALAQQALTTGRPLHPRHRPVAPVGD